ncbi:hypothetical protein C8A05DRAFT_33859 [Staphylotrichum tortipilum]|uniref:C2H2-type domain-containing protein n=1 Tax=Staphylotrichum tortipilum TaxID=2831512 RepID=A0AAN6RU03_9PEZI|nr:hypothetical protein C8A05DRAFT_33859 [Staphylotrichum longicolle]
MAANDNFAGPRPPLAHEGLQALADWESATPPSPMSGMQADSSPASPSSSYGYYYGQHDPTSCIHARDLCNQLYNDFQVSMAELEQRCQCRCGQSTWGRTKSFLGNLTKRALSLRARKKHEEATESEPGQVQEHPPSEDRPHFPVGELSAETAPAELQPGYTFVPELAAHGVSGYSPMSSSASAVSAPPMTLRSMSSGSSTQHLGCPPAAYNPNALMSPPFTPVPRPPRSQVSRLYVPPGQVTHPVMPGQPWPSCPPTPSFTDMSAMSALSVSTMSSSGSHRFISPQSSMSSNPSSIFTDATGFTAPEAPLCDSPGEFDDRDVASWYQRSSTAQNAQWPAASTAAELPGSTSTLGPAQWFRQPSGQQFAEPEGIVSLMESGMPSGPQPYVNLHSMQSMQPLELPTAFNVQQTPSQWHAAQVIDGAKSPPIVPDIPWPSIARHPPAPPQQPRPQPVILPRRQHSYNSAISSILDFPILSGTVVPEPAAQPPSPPLSEYAVLPAQPRAMTKKSVRRRRTQSEPTFCAACEWRPKGPNPRRKMQKHNNTDGHRRKTGQVEAQRVRCWICSSTFNRDDNLWSHVKDKHNLSLPEEDRKRKSAWKKLGGTLMRTM